MRTHTARHLGGNPTLWFASVLRNRFIEEGIVVTGDAVDIDDLTPPPDRSDATMLFTYRSPTLAEIARPLLKESINLYGEAFMRLNADKGSFPTNDAALDGLRKRLTAWGVPEGSYQLVDGSGLSRRDAISPEAVMTVLQRMSDRRAVALSAGAAGCRRRRFTCGRMKGTAAEGNVRAKTGTMSNIRSLAGYVIARNGEHLAFVIVINNFEGTARPRTRRSMPSPFAWQSSRATEHSRAAVRISSIVTDQPGPLSEVGPPTTTTAEAIEQRAKRLARIDRDVL